MLGCLAHDASASASQEKLQGCGLPPKCHKGWHRHQLRLQTVVFGFNRAEMIREKSVSIWMKLGQEPAEHPTFVPWSKTIRTKTSSDDYVFSRRTNLGEDGEKTESCQGGCLVRFSVNKRAFRALQFVTSVGRSGRIRDIWNGSESGWSKPVLQVISVANKTRSMLRERVTAVGFKIRPREIIQCAGNHSSRRKER